MSLLHDLVAGIAESSGRILVVTDFDGTIAEIELDPMAARIDPIARRALRRLARIAADRPDRLAVAVLTGRAVGDVAGRVRVGGVQYLGNHGLDRGWLPRRGRVSTVGSETSPGSTGLAGSAELETPSARLGRSVADALGRPDWLFVEVKGGSVAFHYRRAPVADEALRRLDQAVAVALAADQLDLERFDGRLIVELRPTGAGGKGAAVVRLLEEHQPASVLALGDDRSDAEGFAVLRAERDAGRLAVLTVGVHDRQATPRELLDAADVMLATPRDASRLLSALATILEAG